MMKYIILAFLAIGGVSRVFGQTVIQGDSLFVGLRVGQSSLEQVTTQLGRQYRAEKIISESTGKLRSGGCITIKQVTGVSLHYRKQGMGVVKQIGESLRLSFRRFFICVIKSLSFVLT